MDDRHVREDAQLVVLPARTLLPFIALAAHGDGVWFAIDTDGYTESVAGPFIRKADAPAFASIRTAGALYEEMARAASQLPVWVLRRAVEATGQETVTLPLAMVTALCAPAEDPRFGHWDAISAWGFAMTRAIHELLACESQSHDAFELELWGHGGVQ